MAKGKFIVFEGADGCGKSTQLDKAHQHLVAVLGRPILRRQALGSGTNGQALRGLMKSTGGWDVKAETALMAVAIRCAALEIAPLLEAGQDVLCDRWTMSTLAYQVWGKEGTEGCPPTERLSEAKYLLDDLVPDLEPHYIVLDAPFEIREQRMENRGETKDVIEGNLALQQRLGRAYRILAGLVREQAQVVSASGSIEETWTETEMALRKIYSK